MPVVPMLRAGQGQAASPSPAMPPPDQVFALMAATQMHSEGRLLAADKSSQDAKISSIPTAAQSSLRSQ